jgi:carbonic anhydrase/acetyltransferase-like protein (isoleucine patch superfamily)
MVQAPAGLVELSNGNRDENTINGHRVRSREIVERVMTVSSVRHVAISGFCHIGRGSFLGANSCLADTIRVATDCLINPGMVILRNTEPGQAYIGNPARRVAPACTMPVPE